MADRLTVSDARRILKQCNYALGQLDGETLSAGAVTLTVDSILEIARLANRIQNRRTHTEKK